MPGSTNKNGSQPKANHLYAQQTVDGEFICGGEREGKLYGSFFKNFLWRKNIVGKNILKMTRMTDDYQDAIPKLVINGIVFPCISKYDQTLRVTPTTNNKAVN